VLVASLSPTQIVRVQRPTTKYTETVEGAVEKDGTAKELKFFIRSGSDSMNDQDIQNTNTVTMAMKNESLYIQARTILQLDHIAVPGLFTID
jgi:hypothetical protein